MNDPLSNSSIPGSEQNRTGASMSETLQQALRALGGDRNFGGTGTLTPEMLTQLAQRAGLRSPAQIASLAQMMGVGTDNIADASAPQHVVFALGDADCAFPSEAVQGVERVADVTPVPNTVSWVLGVINLHGAITSLIDLRGYFGMPPQPITPRTRLLVLTQRDMTIGMVVDGVTAMRTLSGDAAPTHTLGVVPTWATPYASRAIILEGRTIILLDPERLLFAEKMHRYRADFS
ncbi:MAG TPA: chemotaxis protein CheW [Ktedonobacterales bacterium]|nr:chemotaxis protein CheW [Ktedonobacterales bacterium]